MESGKDVSRDNPKKDKIGIMRECGLSSSWDLELVTVAKLCR